MENKQIQIPEGWKKNNFGNLISEKPKSQLKVSDATGFGNYPFFTSGEAILLHHKKQIEGENIFLATGGVANVKYHNGEVSYSTDTYALTTDNTDLKYLYYFLLNKLYYINSNYFLGSGLKHLQKKDLKNHSLVLPKSTTEQKKIAEILSKVDTAIEQTQSLIAKYQRIKTGLMQDLLTKGIDENGNIRTEETHEFKDSELGRIPVEWEVEKLEKLSIKIGDGTHASVLFSENEDIPFLFVSCIKPNKVEWSKCTYIDSDVYRIISKGKTPKKGTVLYSIVGSYGNAVVLESNRKLSFQRHIGFIETQIDILLPEFLTYFLNSFFGKKQADDLAVGNAQKTITLGALREFQIFVPKKNEQLNIINKIKFLEMQNNAYIGSYSKLQSLKIALMQDLLSGKKRVTNLIKENAL